MDVIKKKPGKKPGSSKSGGRTKGTPNKNTLKFKELIANTNIDIAAEAVKLFQNSDNESIRLKVLIFLAEYTYSKPKPTEDTVESDELEILSYETSNEDLIKLVK